MLFHQVVLDSLISLAEASVQLPFWRVRMCPPTPPPAVSLMPMSSIRSGERTRLHLSCCHPPPRAQAFVRCVAPAEGHMGASEYELYFNYALRWHPERVCMQQQVRGPGEGWTVESTGVAVPEGCAWLPPREGG